MAKKVIDGLFSFLLASYERKYEEEEKLEQQFVDLKNTFSVLLFELVKNEADIKASSCHPGTTILCFNNNEMRVFTIVS